ncbi:hypothetical protein [Williamsia sp. CHRR-6]|uniref:hypothetical protein n=1 Tax=Williamsia sp. CHRR-6 TaxID=2835871 RepID=UPI0035B2477B
MAQTQPADPEEFGKFCGAVAARYRGRLAALEIWNEPNGTLFFRPEPNAGAYTAMVVSAYRRVKSGAPEMPVVVGALGPLTGTNSIGVAAVEFVAQMYAAGVAGHLDAMSFHPYDFGADLATGGLYDQSPCRQLIAIHALMAAHGDGEKKVWLTEYGAPTVDAITPQRQADLIVATARQWTEVSYAGPMFVYGIRDDQANSPDPEHNYGVATFAFAPKPAVEAVAGLVASPGAMRPEFALFRDRGDLGIGAPVAPVRRQGAGLAYEHERGTVFRVGTRFVVVDTAVAEVARRFRVAASSRFARGIVDCAVPGGFRIFARPGQPAYAIYGAILAAWSPSLGFPVGDQQQSEDGGVAACRFERGQIVWTRSAGTKVTRS